MTDRQPAPTQLVIPDEYRTAAQRAHIIEATHRIAQADVAIVLQRSGALAYWAVVGCAEALGIVLPPTIEVLIGREISGDFEERTGIMLDDYAWRVKADTPLPLQIDGDDRLANYYGWLDKRARRDTSQVSHVIEVLQGIGGSIPHVGHTMIVDDSVYQGPTLYVTAPFVANRAFPEARTSATHLFSADWLGALRTASFPHLQGMAKHTAEAWLVSALMRGGVDYRGFLEPLTADNIRRVGRRLAAYSATQGNLHPRNPVSEMIARWGLPALLSLHQMAVDAMRSYGRSLA